MRENVDRLLPKALHKKTILPQSKPDGVHGVGV